MVGDKMVKVCVDPAEQLLWSHVRPVAPYLRDLVDVLWGKSIFGHWVPPRQYGTAGRPKRNAK